MTVRLIADFRLQHLATTGSRSDPYLAVLGLNGIAKFGDFLHRQIWRIFLSLAIIGSISLLVDLGWQPLVLYDSGS